VEDVLVTAKTITIAAAGDVEQTRVTSWRFESGAGGALVGFTVGGEFAAEIWRNRLDVADCTFLGYSWIWLDSGVWRSDELRPRSDVRVRGCRFHGGLGASNHSLRGGSIGVENCWFQGGDLNIDSESGGASVSHCTFENASAGVGGEASEIWGCSVTNGSIYVGSSHPLLVRASGNIVTSGRIVGDGNVAIVGNTVSGGGIEGSGPLSIARNVVRNATTGVLVDDFGGPGGASVIGNTVVECSGVGVVIEASGVRLEQNLVLSCDRGVVIIGEASEIRCNDVWKNVTNWTGIADPTGVDGNISLDPLFCDRENDVFALRPRSPCLPEASSCGQIGAMGVGCVAPTLFKPIEVAPAERRVRAGPNPTTGPTTFTLERTSDTSAPIVLRIFDAGGRLVGTRSMTTEGAIQWDGRTIAGERVAPGVYYYVLQGTDLEARGKIEVVR
jgi:hypothetical protein